MYGASGGSLSGDPRLPSTGNPRHQSAHHSQVSEHSPVDAGEARHNHSFARLFHFSKAVAFLRGTGCKGPLGRCGSQTRTQNKNKISWLFCGKYNVERAATTNSFKILNSTRHVRYKVLSMELSVAILAVVTVYSFGDITAPCYVGCTLHLPSFPHAPAATSGAVLMQFCIKSLRGMESV